MRGRFIRFQGFQLQGTRVKGRMSANKKRLRVKKCHRIEKRTAEKIEGKKNEKWECRRGGVWKIERLKERRLKNEKIEGRENGKSEMANGKKSMESENE